MAILTFVKFLTNKFQGMTKHSTMYNTNNFTINLPTQAFPLSTQFTSHSHLLDEPHTEFASAEQMLESREQSAPRTSKNDQVYLFHHFGGKYQVMTVSTASL